MNDDEVIYFELNDWIPGEGYPDEYPFDDWVEETHEMLLDEKWLAKNKLCVVADYVDMSINFCITATKEWVNKNCPELLTNYTQFLRFPDKDGCVKSKLTGDEFLPYDKKNIGLHYGDYEENTDYGYIDDEYDDSLIKEIEEEFGNMNVEFDDDD